MYKKCDLQRIHLLVDYFTKVTATMTSQVYDIINICDNGAAGTAPLSNKHDYSKQVTRYLPIDECTQLTPQQTNQTILIIYYTGN